MSCARIFDCLPAPHDLPKCSLRVHSPRSHQPSRSRGCRSSRWLAPNRETLGMTTTHHRWKCRARRSVDSSTRTASGTECAYSAISDKGALLMRHASCFSLLLLHLSGSRMISICQPEDQCRSRTFRSHNHICTATVQRHVTNSRPDAARSIARIFEKPDQFFWGLQP